MTSAAAQTIVERLEALAEKFRERIVLGDEVASHSLIERELRPLMNTLGAAKVLRAELLIAEMAHKAEDDLPVPERDERGRFVKA